MKRLIACMLVVPGFVALPSAQQAARSWVEVDHGGFYVRRELTPSTPSLHGPAAGASLSQSAAQLRWIYPNPPALPWVSESVSVGDFGAFAWLGQNVNGEQLSFVATTDDSGSPPQPIFEPLFDGADLVVRAADKSPAAVVSEIDFASSTFALHYFTGFSAAPVHTIGQPALFEVAISDDGSRFAAGYTNGSGRAQVDVYDATALAPTVPIQTLTATELSAFRHHDISGDGSTVLLASDGKNYVFDVDTGNEIFSDSSTISHDAHAIDADGDAWGRGGLDIRAWVHDGATYNEVLNFIDGGLGFMLSTTADISADGSTLAAAAYDPSDDNQFRIYVWDLTATGSTRLWTYSHTGSGSFPDIPSAVSVSDDGRWIAVGAWGSEFGTHAEALLFDRDAGNVPVASLNTPGSVLDVDLSGDGQFWVIGTKSVHAYVLGNGGWAYSFDRGDQGHSLAGTASIGRSIDLETYGSSGELVLQALATALLPAPLQLAGFTGALEIDPTTLVGPVFVVGAIGGGGVVASTLSLPGSVSLIGTTIFSQSVRIGPNALENHLRFSITP